MSTEQASVQIDAPMETVFDLLVEDRTDFSQNDEVRWREAISEGPVRVGYCYKSTFVHQRHECVMHIRVTEFEPGRILEEDFFHSCAVEGRTVRGTSRFELLPHGEGTTLVMTVRRRVSGVAGLLMSLLGSNCSSRMKLEYIRSRAEVRHAPLQASA